MSPIIVEHMDIIANLVVYFYWDFQTLFYAHSYVILSFPCLLVAQVALLCLLSVDMVNLMIFSNWREREREIYTNQSLHRDFFGYHLHNVYHHINIRYILTKFSIPDYFFHFLVIFAACCNKISVPIATSPFLFCGLFWAHYFSGLTLCCRLLQ